MRPPLVGEAAELLTVVGVPADDDRVATPLVAWQFLVSGDGGIALLRQVGDDPGADVLEGEELVGGEGVEAGGVVPVAVAAQDGFGPLLEAR